MIFLETCNANLFDFMMKDCSIFLTELARRQEELRMLEEDIQKKRHMPQMGHGGPPMMGGPQGPGFGGRGPPQSGPR